MEMAASDDKVLRVTIGGQVPRRGNVLSRVLGRAILRVMRWRVEGQFPDLPKMVIIGAPHTSNLDAVIAVAAQTALGLRTNLMGKHTLFWGPLGFALRWFGVIPVDRKGAHGIVERSVAAFNSSERLLLLIAPEGTRKAPAAWKRGFWVIASSAGVPILPAAFDYKSRRIVIGPPLMPSGDYDADLRRLLDFYRENAGPRYPDRASAPICAVLGLDWRSDAKS